MASSSSSSNPLLGVHITKKLSKGNHALWQVQVLTVICNAAFGKPLDDEEVASYIINGLDSEFNP